MGEAVETIATSLDVAATSVHGWPQMFLVEGVVGLRARRRGGGRGQPSTLSRDRRRWQLRVQQVGQFV